ncbi:Predicted dehydrogenase [Evansella caseinilytica]|uniref:Predicted dehydrogenase n=1 Tax=Evansella caseinilytica TaxID=1503961 RepID=A0A1H3RAL2_9BACI|nr:Predicted dehydrogenase [Evansella caseinilytica]
MMVRFGIIGTNWITERFLDAAKDVDGFVLSAVYSRKQETAAAFAGKYHVTATYTSIEEMISGDTVDAVYIASPNSFHAEQAVLCMNHGKHVLCEKPLASNVHEVQMMIDAAKRNDVLLMEGLKTTVTPNFLAVKNNLHKIGPVRKYIASYCQYSSRYDAFKEGNVLNAFKPDFSNGALMDIGIYCVYPLVALFGAPIHVQASGMLLSSGVDGQGSLLLTYDGMDAAIAYSKIANSYLPMEIQGENGSILMDKVNTPEKVEIHYRDGSVEDISVRQHANSMYDETLEFIEVIRSGSRESKLNTFRNSLITATILEEARKQIGVVYPADQREG